jgi:hypothetical protein
MSAEPLTPLANSRNCERCGAAFAVSPKSPRQRFCSLSCSNSRPRRRASEADRFWVKVDKAGPVSAHRPDLGPCWVWTATRNPYGYGQFYLSGGPLVVAHRWAWEQVNGPVPDGLVLDHLCRHPACVHPEHLEAVTEAVNIQRGLAGDLKPPLLQREKCANGHELTPENRFLRKDRPRKQYLCRKCSAERQRRYAERKREAA